MWTCMLVNNLNTHENGDIIETFFFFNPCFTNWNHWNSTYVWLHSQAQPYILVSMHIAVVYINCINLELTQPKFYYFQIKRKSDQKMS